MIKINRNQKPYVIGFVTSTVLTLTAYILVTTEVFAGWKLFFIIIGLAIIQLLVQVTFFLHIGHEEKPRWQLITFMFAGLVVLIVVIGSLWIMNNLDYHHDHALPSDEDIIQDEGIHHN